MPLVGLRGRTQGCRSSCQDHPPERSRRHLDTCQFETRLIARIPGVKCLEHSVVQASVPWAGKHARFTLLMGRLPIDVLLAGQTVQAAREVLGHSWDLPRVVRLSDPQSPGAGQECRPLAETPTGEHHHLLHVGSHHRSR